MEIKKTLRIIIRVLALILTVLLVIGAVWLVANRDRFTSDALSRWYRYLTISRNDTGVAEAFPYEGQPDDQFADLDKGLLVASSSGIRLYSVSGTLYYNLAVPMEHPALCTGGNHAAVYSVGGNTLSVVDSAGELASLPLTDGIYFSASLNEQGYLATVSRENNYKSVVTVYDADCAPVSALRLTSRFASDALVSADCRSVAVLTIGMSSESTFETTFALYALDGSDQPYATCSLGNDTVLALRPDGEGYKILGEKGLYFVTEDGTLSASYSFGGNYLKACDLGGDGTVAVLLSKYTTGTSSTLAVVDRTGAVQASMPINEQVSAIACRDRYVAILTATRLELRTAAQLESHYTLSETNSARNLVLRTDGSAILISADSASLYIPE